LILFNLRVSPVFDEPVNATWTQGCWPEFHGWTECPCRSLAPSCRPLALNLHSSFAPGCVLTKATPLPIFRALTQSALHRIPVDITKLLHKLTIVPDVEIVIALLPEMLGKIPTQANSGLEWGTRDPRKAARRGAPGSCAVGDPRLAPKGRARTWGTWSPIQV
jgi:hypothetical protein